ncbi:MAG: hypothetical protein HGB21_04830 [Nitrospirae bacterium]|nr:hypothetical protein [Nitrospirota bacterium]NTW65627.1 hypothetical protein [Nitrospirota bacterium]
MKQHLFTMFMAGVVAVAVLVMLGAALPVFAQSINPCTEDMKTICGDITKGGGRLLRCYEERKDKISTDCRAWVEGAKANADALKKACSKEIDARCNFEKGDPLEMLDCLQGNYIDLSMQCRERLNEFKGRYPKPLH